MTITVRSAEEYRRATVLLRARWGPERWVARHGVLPGRDARRRAEGGDHGRAAAQGEVARHDAGKPAAVVLVPVLPYGSGVSNMRLMAAADAMAAAAMDGAASAIAAAHPGFLPRAVSLARLVGDALETRLPALLPVTDLIVPGGWGPPPGGDGPGRDVGEHDLRLAGGCMDGPGTGEPRGKAELGSPECAAERRVASSVQAATRIVDAGSSADGGAAELYRRHASAGSVRRRGAGEPSMCLAQVSAEGEWSCQPQWPAKGDGGVAAGCGGGVTMAFLRDRPLRPHAWAAMAYAVGVGRCTAAGLAPVSRLIVAHNSIAWFPMQSAGGGILRLAIAAAVAMPLAPWIERRAAVSRSRQGCDAASLVLVHPRLERDWAEHARMMRDTMQPADLRDVTASVASVLGRSSPSCVRLAMAESEVEASALDELTRAARAAAPAARLMRALDTDPDIRPSGSGGGDGDGSLAGSVIASYEGHDAADGRASEGMQLPYTFRSAVESAHAVAASVLLGHSASTFDALAAARRLVAPGVRVTVESVTAAMQAAAALGAGGGRSAMRINPTNRESCDLPSNRCTPETLQLVQSRLYPSEELMRDWRDGEAV